MEIKEQVRIMENLINSPAAEFSLIEKMKCLSEWFGDDPEYSREARNIVASNISRKLELREEGRDILND